MSDPCAMAAAGAASAPTAVGLVSPARCARVVRAPGGGVVLEADHPRRALEVARPARDRVVTAPLDLHERERIDLDRGLERHPQRAVRLRGGAAPIAVRVEAADELLRARRGDDARRREDAVGDRPRVPVPDQPRRAAAVAVHPEHVVGRVVEVPERDDRLDPVHLRAPRCCECACRRERRGGREDDDREPDVPTVHVASLPGAAPRRALAAGCAGRLDERWTSTV